MSEIIISSIGTPKSKVTSSKGAEPNITLKFGEGRNQHDEGVVMTSSEISRWSNRVENWYR